MKLKTVIATASILSFSVPVLATNVGPELVVCKTDFCKSSHVVNTQVNKHATQVSTVNMKRNTVVGDVTLNATTVGNNLSVEVDSDVVKKHNDVVVDTVQKSSFTTQSSVVNMVNNRVDSDSIEVDATAISNAVNVTGLDRTVVDSSQVNKRTTATAAVNVKRNNAPRRDPIITSTALGNTASFAGTVVKADTFQRNTHSKQRSTVNYVNNNLGPIDINAGAFGNNVSVSVK